MDYMINLKTIIIFISIYSGDCMSNYIDKFGLYHDKPVALNMNPSSNNGFIYTAYANMLKLPVDKEQLRSNMFLFYTNYHNLYNFSMNRLPTVLTPPMSRDEIIGLTSLGLLDFESLHNSGYLYHFDQLGRTPKHPHFMDTLLAIKALFPIRNKHRNTVWKDRIYDAYTLAFRLSPADIYYVKSMNLETPTILETVLFHTYAMITSFSNDTSAKNILSLQLHDLKMFKHPAMKFLNVKKQFIEYFGKEHIFNR